MAEKKRGEEIDVKADVLFEVSWEVCNKVGGINTVIESKIPTALEKYGDNYFLVGPYFYQKVKGIFEETVVPEEYKPICESLKSLGIVIHCGKWLTDGNPHTILIDFQRLFEKKDDIKRMLWESYQIDSLNSGFDFDEPVIWAWAAGMVIENFSRNFPKYKIAAIFHEWLSGAALLYLKSVNAMIGKIFVTHATVIGRSFANAGIDLYSKKEDGKCLLCNLDFDKEAYNRNVHSKHQLEKASAHNADVFATVSEITSMEAEMTLKKKADILVPNGIDLNTFPSIEENSIMHRFFRDKIYHFLLSYFFPYYNIDIENTLVYFIASRYEVRDKGIDVLIKSLGKLNDALRHERSRKNIVVFFWVPTGIRGIKPEIVENKVLFKDIDDSIKENTEEVMMKILNSLLSDGEITKETLFNEQLRNGLKNKILKYRRESAFAPVCTHDLIDQYDQILALFDEQGLNNAEDCRVKVILYPIYLTGADGLLDLTYHEAMQGSHLGIFPSFYEPWGYTPLEAGALGVSSITSDLAGFGRYIEKHESYKGEGIYVVKRMDKNDDEVIESIFRILYDFSNASRKQRIEDKFEARRLASFANWALLSINYTLAQNLALEKAGIK